MKNELINGRTPEQIKIGLSCSGSKGNVKCEECAYCMGQFGDEDCDYNCDQIDNDALALIEHLEERLINEITRRDNLLAEMGIHLPEDEPMEWEYKHIRGAWRRVSSDGWVICPRCKTVQIRLVGTWYKHCPERGKRMETKEE